MSRRCLLLLVLVFFFPAPAATAEDAFPRQGILPKQEIGALRLLSEHPEHDGRGVVVAVFDTGVDPGAEGLQLTSDGQPKIVDLVDATGSGDVDTSELREAEDGQLTGLTGRRLRLADDWQNPSGKYHLGLKAAYELFPRRLVPRLKAKRREAWDVRQRAAVARLQRQIERWDKAHPHPNDAQQRQLKELKKRLQLLPKLAGKYKDPGPVFDCLVFHDGQVWRAAIDTDEDGDLRDEKLLTDFRRERQYATFGQEDVLNYAVNIYDQGNLLSIVTDSGAHGTHVAGIIAAHYPQEPELNGIAPGAQIVGVKIGDTRVGTSSLGTGPVRGLIAVLENGCDLINMSYGGASSYPNQGRITQLYQEIVDRHGVIFVASAGNSGPGLSTVTSPGGTTSALLGVGAYVSPELMQVGYSLRQRLGEIPFTWSSRGPTADGDLGVDVTAPGGARAPVPNWALQRNRLMNGTSMSSPNACGAIALLLSGLKARKQYFTPYTVRRALEQTARPLDNSDVFAHGRGLIQVDGALDYLQQHPASKQQPLRYQVRLPLQGRSRGIYLREPADSRRVLDTKVEVRPLFHRDAPHRRRIAFQQRILLQCEADWVKTPQHLVLSHEGRSFEVRVDPTGLPPGAHFTEILAHAAGQPDRGPLLRVPITVICPEMLPADKPAVWGSDLSFEPGQLQRFFLAVPEGASWADLRLRAGDNDSQRMLVVHAVQLLPERPFDDTSVRKYLTLQPRQHVVQSFAVTGGRTLELCVAQFWSSLGSSRFEVEVTFHGLTVTDPEPELDGARLTRRLELAAPLGDERLAPQVKLDTLRHTLRPQTSELRVLGSQRDRLPDDRQLYELILDYAFTLDAEAEITPRPALNLTEATWREHESHLWLVFDQNKRRVGGGTRGSLKLRKGAYVLRYHVRHEDPQQLQRLKQTALFLDRKLSKPLALDVYGSQLSALRGGARFGEKLLRRGQRTALHLAALDAAKLPTQAAAGDLLLGTIHFGKSESQQQGSGQRPGGYDLRYRVPPRPAAPEKQAAGDETASEQADPSLPQRLEAAQLTFLAELRRAGKREEFERLAARLSEQLEDQRSLLIERLKLLDDKQRKPHLPEIVVLADDILSGIDTEALARHLGTRASHGDSSPTEQQAHFEQERKVLVDTLYRKARALAYMDLPPKYGVPPKDEVVAKHPDSKKARGKLFEETFAELQKWVDTTEPKYVLLHLRRLRRHGQYGAALELLDKHIQRSPPQQLLHSKRVDILHELKWPHWRDYERQWMLLRFPPDYPPF